VFDRILSLFHPKATLRKLPPADAQHALGALLVRMAKIDKAYLFEEIEHIDALLAHRYNLGPLDAAKLRAECEALELKMPETSKLTDVLQETISTEEREQIVLSLWEVVFADGVEVESEDDFLTQIEELLGVSPARSKELHDVAMSASDVGKL